MAIDWTIVTYLVIGFFAVIGFFRGWWKEAITAFALAGLVILLQHPDWAQAVIDFINWIIAEGWSLVAQLFSLSLGAPPQFEATSAGTWLIILIVVLGLAAVIGSISLPGYSVRAKATFYAVSPVGRLLGVVLGVINGFLVLSLVREYLDGRALPGSAAPETEIAVSGSTVGAASSSLTITAVNLPSATIMDSYIPWMVIGFGLLIFFAAIRNRVRVASSADGKKVEGVPPYGYKRYEKNPPVNEKPVRVEMVPPEE